MDTVLISVASNILSSNKRGIPGTPNLPLTVLNLLTVPDGNCCIQVESIPLKSKYLLDLNVEIQSSWKLKSKHLEL